MWDRPPEGDEIAWDWWAKGWRQGAVDEAEHCRLSAPELRRVRELLYAFDESVTAGEMSVDEALALLASVVTAHLPPPVTESEARKRRWRRMKRVRGWVGHG